MEPNSEIKLCRVSEGTFRARFLMRNSGFDLVCLLVYGIPTFDSESFERELNGSMGHLWLQFRPIPFSVFGDQVSPHVHHERTTLKGVRASTLKRLLRAPFFTRAVSFARTSNAFYRTTSRAICQG